MQKINQNLGIILNPWFYMYMTATIKKTAEEKLLQGLQIQRYEIQKSDISKESEPLLGSDT